MQTSQQTPKPRAGGHNKPEDSSQKQMSAIGKGFQGLGSTVKDIGSFASEQIEDVLESFTPKDPSTEVPVPISPAEMVDLFDPDLSAQGKSLETSSMLATLMATDEMLSRADQDLLVRYYNQISKLAPRAALEPLIVGPLLRKMLNSNGQLDPIDAKALTDLELSLKKRDEISPESLVLA